MTRGLVLGKFAPFHHGHQLLVSRSLAETEETVVLVYDSPEVTRIPLARRAQWIRTLNPAARVIEGKDAPSASGHDPAVMRLQEDYIRSMMPGPVTHVYTSEWYGAHVSAALGARDCRIDEARQLIPASGTALRTDPYAHRHLVDPLVYRDLQRWVVLLGAESTGKSTLARALARHFDTCWVPEHGRDFWLAHKDDQGRLSPEQLVALAHGHRENEETSALDANRLLFIDTDARITRHYARWYHSGRVHPALDQLAEACAARYHAVVLCDTDIPYEDDGTRAGETRRHAAQAEIIAELHATSTPFILANGPLARRVTTVANHLRTIGFDHWC